MKIRDLFAVPFLFIALCFNLLAVLIGGAWTAHQYLRGEKGKK